MFEFKHIKVMNNARFSWCRYFTRLHPPTAIWSVLYWPAWTHGGVCNTRYVTCRPLTANIQEMGWRWEKHGVLLSFSYYVRTCSLHLRVSVVSLLPFVLFPGKCREFDIEPWPYSWSCLGTVWLERWVTRYSRGRRRSRLIRRWWMSDSRYNTCLSGTAHFWVIDCNIW